MKCVGGSVSVKTEGKVLVLPSGNPDILPSHNEYVLNSNRLTIAESPFGGLKGSGSPDFAPGTIFCQTDGVYLQDTSGTNSTKTLTAGKLKELNLLSVNAPAHTITEEFQIVNTSESNNPTVIDACNDVTGWTVQDGTGDITTSNNKIICTGVATSGVHRIVKTWNVTGLSIHFFKFTIRCTQACRLQLTLNSSGSQYLVFSGARFSIQANTDTTFVLPLKTSVGSTLNYPTTRTAGYDPTAVYRASIGVGNCVTGSENTIEVSNICVDVAKPSYLEIQTPDVLADSSIQIYTHNGTTYQLYKTCKLNTAYENISSTDANCTFADGMKISDVYGATGEGRAIFPKGASGQTKSGSLSGSLITYFSNKGTKNRIGLRVDLPPSDNGRTNSHKIRIKTIIYYAPDSSEKYSATYQFEDSTSASYGLQNLSKPWIALYNPSQKPNYISYGFWPYDVDSSEHTPNWDSLTHISFFAWEPNPDGTLDAPGNPQSYAAIKTSAHEHGVKVTIAIPTNNQDHIDSILANYSQTFANNVLSAIQNNDADGVCLDFEYPRATNNITSTSNTDLFETFLATLYNTLKTANPDYHISFCMGSNAAVLYWRNADLSQYVDSVIYMGYDFSWMVTGANSPYPTPNNIILGIEALQQYYPNDKIILALPFYGYDYTCDSNLKGATATNQVYIPMSTAIQNSTIYGRQWDSESNSPWYAYQDGEQWHQVWYDDLESLNIKIQYAIGQLGLSGVGYWAVGYEDINVTRSLYLISDSHIVNPNLDFFLFTHRPKKLEFKRDDSGNVREVTLYPGNGQVYHGRITHCDSSAISSKQWDVLPGTIYTPTDGVHITDISGTNSSTTLAASLLQGRGELVVDAVNHTITEEFIVRNDSVDTTPIVIDDCSNTTGWTVNDGTGEISASNAQITLTGNASATGIHRILKIFNLTGISSNFVKFTVRNSQSCNLQVTYSSSSSEYCSWSGTRFAIAANTDTTFVLPLLAPSGTVGQSPTSKTASFDPTKLYRMIIGVAGIPFSSANIITISDIQFDTPKSAYIELMTPDILSTPSTLTTQYWTGTSYETIRVDSLNSTYANVSLDTTKAKFLDGTKMDDVYGVGLGRAIYPKGSANEIVDGSTGSITYSNVLPSQKRIGLMVKLPPSDNERKNFNKIRLRTILNYDPQVTLPASLNKFDDGSISKLLQSHGMVV